MLMMTDFYNKRQNPCKAIIAPTKYCYHAIGGGRISTIVGHSEGKTQLYSGEVATKSKIKEKNAVCLLTK
jgi:hypothetical protein